MPFSDRDFLDEVRRLSGLESRRHAESAALSVLTHLVGRLSWREQQDLAAKLPPRLRRRVLAAPNTDLRYAAPAVFLRDVADELLVSPARAEEIARAVGGVVAQNLPAEELGDLRAELNTTFEAVFGADHSPLRPPAEV